MPPSSSRSACSLLAFAALAVACGEPPPATTVSTRDSAGVAIMTLHTSPWIESAPWHVAEAPTVAIGTVDGPASYQLDRVEGALRLSNGTIVVADAGSSEIRFFDAAGRFLRASGRPGGGPGEYRQIASLGRGPGDSLWVYDFGARRMSVLTSQGTFVRSVSMGGELSAVVAVGRLPDGAFVIREVWSAHAGGRAPALGLTRSPAAIAKLTADGAALDTIGLFPGREVFISTEDGRGVMSAPPFARTASVALRNDQIIVGDQERFELRAYSPSGTLLSIAHAPTVDLELSPERVAAYIDDVVAAQPETERAMTRRHLEGLTPPPTMPAYGDVLADADDNLWVAEYTPSEEPARRWAVLDPRGAPIGTVTVPARFHVYDIGTDWILGVQRDDFDAEHVWLCRIDKQK